MSTLKRAGNVLSSQDQIDIRRDIGLGTSAVTDVAASGDASSAQVVKGNDSRLTDSREWTAATVSQAEAEAGSDTNRRAWTVVRVWQAIAAWWLSISTAAGRTLLTAADATAQRTALGLGTAATTAATAYATAAQGAKADGAAQIAGDLGGTAAAPVVSKINGVAVTGTPTAGQVPTATSGTAATWQTPSGSGGTPGGSGGQFQYNNGGSFAGSPTLSEEAAGLLVPVGKYMRFASDVTQVRISWHYTDNLYGIGSYASGTGFWWNGLRVSIATNIRVWNGGMYGWSSSATPDSQDTALERVSAGVVGINNGTAGQYRDLKLRNLIVTGGVDNAMFTTATRPAFTNGRTIFDSDQDKLLIGGASGWEVITSA